jgi:hypothetical protein
MRLREYRLCIITSSKTFEGETDPRVRALEISWKLEWQDSQDPGS